MTSRSTASATRSSRRGRTRSRTISNRTTWSGEPISARVSTTSADNEKDEKRKNDLQHQLFELEKRLHAYRIRVEDIDAKTEKNKGLHRRGAGAQEGRREQDRRADEEPGPPPGGKGRSREQSGVEIGQKDRGRPAEAGGLLHDAEEEDRFHPRLARLHRGEEAAASRTRKRTWPRSSRALLEEVIRKLVDAIEKRKAELEGSEAGARPGAEQHRRADGAPSRRASAGRGHRAGGGHGRRTPSRRCGPIDMGSLKSGHPEVRELRGRVPLDPLRQDRHPCREGGPGPEDTGKDRRHRAVSGTRSRPWRRTSSTSRRSWKTSTR